MLKVIFRNKNRGVHPCLRQQNKNNNKNKRIGARAVRRAARRGESCWSAPAELSNRLFPFRGGGYSVSEKGFPDFPDWIIGLIGKLNQFGKKHKSATLQNFATIARRSSTALLNSGFWPLDDAALLNFATMRIYAICRTESVKVSSY